MKRASWALRAISLLLAYAGLSSCTSIEPDAAPRGTIHLIDAEFATSTPGDIVAMPPKTIGPLPSLSWTRVSLPNALPRVVVPSRGGSDFKKMESITMWYRIEVPSSQVTAELTALYLPRWHTWGNLAIYANGALIYSSVQEGIFGAFNDPLLARVPVESTVQRTLQLLVRMDSVRATGGALSTVWLGPVTELRRMFDTRRLLQNLVPQITSSIFLVLGGFALGFWIRRRHEITQLLFFVLSVLFYLRNLHYYIDNSWFPDDWFSWITVNSLGWIDVVVYFFAYSLHRQRFRILDRLLIGAMTAASFVTLPLRGFENSLALFSPLAYLIFTAVSFTVTILLTVVAWRVRSLECGALAIVLWLNLGLGVHDWLLQNWRTDVESIYLLPIGVVALFAMFLTTVLRRYLAALSANEKAATLLEVRLSDRERELRESYDKLRDVEQAQLLSEERQRLMREMHDGLGSALMSSLVAVERGQMQPGDIAQVLRECVDDLKLTIDSLEPVGDDLLVLLATLRYRLEPRLEAAGVKLSWEVQPVPTLAWLNPGSALQILRMLQEILTNILKHARAHSIRVGTLARENKIVIEVTDDGVGFDVSAGRNAGRGLKNLQRRAADIGGEVEIESRSNGTSVRIYLQILRK